MAKAASRKKPARKRAPRKSAPKARAATLDLALDPARFAVTHNGVELGRAASFEDAEAIPGHEAGLVVIQDTRTGGRYKRVPGGAFMRMAD